MNRWKFAISLGGMLGVLLLTSAATTQQDPERSGLQQLGGMQSVVEEALRNSAEVHLAEAKVRQAELELTQVRMSVVRQVVSLVSDIQEAEQSLEYAKRSLAQTHQLHQQAMVSETELLQDEAEVINLTGQVQRMNLELDFLAGRINLGGEAEFRGLGGAPGTKVPAMSERKLPEALLQPMEASFEGVSLPMVLELVLKGTGVQLVHDWQGLDQFTVNLTMNGTRVQWLTALMDLGEDMVLVVRDYGLFLTSKENARNYNALTIPVDFTTGG